MMNRTLVIVVALTSLLATTNFANAKDMCEFKQDKLQVCPVLVTQNYSYSTATVKPSLPVLSAEEELIQLILLLSLIRYRSKKLSLV